MLLDKDYFETWMRRLIEKLECIEETCSRIPRDRPTVLPNDDRLLDNSDLCRMLNISKRTLQRYRSLGDLPYEMIYHKTFYRESEVLKFIERHFSKSRNMKKTSSE